MFDDVLLEGLDDVNIEEGMYEVVLESLEIIELRKNTIEKLKNSRSLKERQRWLKKLRNLSKIKRVKDDNKK